MDYRNRKPIHYAASCVGSKPLELLMKIGVDMKDIEYKKNTPFMIACKLGRLENVKLLLESNKDIGYA
jgi:ankyrin repeat protein